MKTSVVSVIDRHIKNPYGAPPDKLDTLSRWNLLLGSLAQGTLPSDCVGPPPPKSS